MQCRVPRLTWMPPDRHSPGDPAPRGSRSVLTPDMMPSMWLPALRSVLLPVTLLLLPAWLLPGASGAASSSGTTSTVVAFRPRDPAGLQPFLHALYDPRSPHYHRFLTPEEFARRFAPLPRDREALIGWLEGRGLQVRERFRD